MLDLIVDLVVREYNGNTEETKLPPRNEALKTPTF